MEEIDNIEILMWLLEFPNASFDAELLKKLVERDLLETVTVTEVTYSIVRLFALLLYIPQ